MFAVIIYRPRFFNAIPLWEIGWCRFLKASVDISCEVRAKGTRELLESCNARVVIID